MDIIRGWSRATEESLWKLSELGSLVNHKGLIGYTREGQLRELLSNFLPNTVSIGSGEIIDHKGAKSKQMDVIVSRGNSCRFPLSKEVSIYPIESVLATIEIKTSLNKKTLADAVNNQNSGDYEFSVVVPDFRTDLQKEKGETLTKKEIGKFPTEKLCHSTYVYFFKSGLKDPAETLSKIIFEICNEFHIDLKTFPSVIAVPGAVFIKNDGVLIPEHDTSLPWVFAYREESHPLYWILAHLMNRLAYTSGGPSAPGLSATYNMDLYLDMPTDNWNLLCVNPNANNG